MHNSREQNWSWGGTSGKTSSASGLRCRDPHDAALLYEQKCWLIPIYVKVQRTQNRERPPTNHNRALQMWSAHARVLLSPFFCWDLCLLLVDYSIVFFCLFVSSNIYCQLHFKCCDPCRSWKYSGGILPPPSQNLRFEGGNTRAELERHKDLYFKIDSLCIILRLLQTQPGPFGNFCEPFCQVALGESLQVHREPVPCGSALHH